MSENLNQRFNSKTRVFIVLAVFLLAVATIIGAWFHFSKKQAFSGSAEVSANPKIASLPGGGNESEVYVKAQNDQNDREAREARKKAGSFVPTFTRSGFSGFSDDLLDRPKVVQSQSPHACPIKQVVYMYKPNPANCELSAVQRAREAGVTAEELLCQSCACSILLDAGYTVGDLKSVGYSALDLKNCGASLSQLKAAGFSASDLKAAGFSAKDLKKAGFSAGELAEAKFNTQELKAAGFSAKDLKKAGFSAGDLKRAGYSTDELVAAGIPLSQQKNNEISKIPKLCTPEEIKKLQKQGVSVADLKNKGCSLGSLRAAGYTATELKNAGFTAGQLKAAGFSATDLKNAGFSAQDLKNAGFSAQDLKKSGFSANSLKAAGFTAGALKHAGFTAAELKNAGFSGKDLKEAGFSAKDLKSVGFSPEALNRAGYTKGDLLRAGLTPKQVGYVTKSPVQTETSELGSIPVLPVGDRGDPFSAKQAASIPTMSATDNRLADIRDMEGNLFTQEQRRAAVQQIQEAMQGQAQQLMTEWSRVSSPQIYQARIIDNEPPASEIGNMEASSRSGPWIKAGTVMFAVLDTGINSDEQSPILATIVTGSLKGAKVIGNFVLSGKKVVVNFTVMNIPRFHRTLPINAVAIDAGTARTALADHVDSHWLLRYGSVFAASFLSGISEGVLASTQNSGSFGPFHWTTTKDGLSPIQYTLLGLGKAGQKYADAVGDKFNVPPTVTVEGGAGIGLLFMSDLQLAESSQSASTSDKTSLPETHHEGGDRERS